MRRFQTFLLISINVVSFISAALADDTPARPIIKIGLIAPLSGAMAQSGAVFRNAAELALEDIPAASRFRYELVIEDDRLEPKGAAAAAAKLINIDKVDAIISTWSYGGSIVAPLAERAKILHFGVAWDATIADGAYSFIHLTPPREFVAKILDVLTDLKCHRLASYGVTESGALYALDWFDRLAKERGATVVKRTEMGWDVVDFKPIILAALKEKPQAIYVNHGAVTDVFMKQARDLGVKIPIVAMTGFDVIHDLSLADGRWYVSDSYIRNELTERLTKRAGTEQVYGAGNYYDIVRLISYIFERSEAQTKPSSTSLLGGIDASIRSYHSIFGFLEMDARGIISYPAQYIRIRGGKRIPTSREEIVKEEPRCQE